MLRRFAPILALLAACATEPGDELDDLEGYDDLDVGKGDGPLGDWTSIGTGVAYQRVNTGPGVLIAYGGYSARLGYTAAWASELVDARLGAADVGHIYAVKGPADAAYAAREIANTKLRAHLRSLATNEAPIYIVAHSSGSFVAHELLAQEHATADSLLARIGYANLDGGGSGLNAAIVRSLRAMTFVYAQDPTLGSGLSQNSGSMTANGATYAPAATTFEVVVPNTGCASGARWCLHDVVITHRPHNRNSYDLARDYTDFENRPVTTEYLGALID